MHGLFEADGILTSWNAFTPFLEDTEEVIVCEFGFTNY